MKAMQRLLSKARNVTGHILLGGLFAAVQGCSISAYVSDNYAPITETVPFSAEYPLAREIKFVFADGSIVSGVGGSTSFLFATNLDSKEEINQHGISYIKQNYPGVDDKDFISTSALTQKIYLQDSNLAAQGRAALDKQNSGRDLSINEAASTQTLGLSTSIDSSIGLMNSYLATMDALSSLAKSMHENDGYRLINWVSNNTGAIGDNAEVGSVLYLDFIRVLEGRSFQLSSESDIIVTATLERPNKETLRSTKAVHLSIYSGGDPTAEQIRNKLVYKQVVASLAEQSQMKPVKNVIFGLDLATLANAAIQDIYRQLD